MTGVVGGFVGGVTIEAVRGDIALQQVDAVVNAANPSPIELVRFVAFSDEDLARYLSLLRVRRRGSGRRAGRASAR